MAGTKLASRQKRMLILLAAMSLGTFGGPVGIGFVLRGGASRSWPPDRPLEWATLYGVSGLVIACLLGIVALGLVQRREAAAAEAERKAALGEAPR
jgi:hypothetical protein